MPPHSVMANTMGHENATQINSESFKSGGGNIKSFDKDRGPRRVMSHISRKYSRHRVIFQNIFDKSQIR